VHEAVGAVKLRMVPQLAATKMGLARVAGDAPVA
jgi:hypothetical protein